MKVAVVGEAMFEFLGQAADGGGLRYAGDTLNTAVHMARAGCDVAYLTAVGADPLSDALVAAWAGEGIDTRCVLRHPDRHPGIYAIHVDARGERSFLYWRDQSAARAMFDLPAMTAAVAAASGAELLYFSLISLAILTPAGREQLIALAASVRAGGGQVAYDSNFRPRLWESIEAARHWSDRAAAVATIGLPTGDDERALHGTREHDSGVAARWLALGCAEVAVKAGPSGCVLAVAGSPPRTLGCRPLAMVDSSGAGDAFNGGYLSARLGGAAPAEAALRGHTLAGWAISRRGALPARDAEAPYPAEARA
jgi:2-dehydro-3-deoxygluconokinase